jgi:hypothetical protein
MRVWGTYDGQRRPSSSFILATVSVLEPQLEEIFPFILELNNDPDEIVASLGLNFNPEEQLDLVESAHSVAENAVNSDLWHQMLPKYQPVTPDVLDIEVENNDKSVPSAYFSRDLENLSPNLSPARREAFTLSHSLLGKGTGGLGFALVFPHGVKSQVPSVAATTEVPGEVPLQTQTESQPWSFSAIVTEVESQSESVQSVAVASTPMESKSNSLPLMTTTLTKVQSKSQSMPFAFFSNKLESKSQSVPSVTLATRVESKSKPRSLVAVANSDEESKSKSVSLAGIIASKVESKAVSSVTHATQVEGKGRLVTTPRKNAHNQVNAPPASSTHLANWIDEFCQGVGCEQEDTRLIR